MNIQRHLNTPLLAGLVATAIAPLHAGVGPGPIGITPISTVRNGDAATIFDESAAEIVQHDPETQRIFVVNGATDSIDIFDVSNPLSPSLFRSVDLSAFGNPNSVAVDPSRNANEVAVAVGADSNADRGVVVFLSTDGDVLDNVQAGFLPDMLTYCRNGKFLVVANEGEPNDDYSVDPEGSVTVIETKGRNRNRKVTEIGFGNLTLDHLPGVRISGPPGTSIAQDLEPEYIACDPSGRHAYVVCQENNAILVVDLQRKEVERGFGLKSVDHAQLGNAIDASDRDEMIRIANWPVHGLPMPDAIAAYEAEGEGGGRGNRRETYIVTANEGDGRDYDGYTDESRIKDLDLDPSAFPLGDVLKEDENIGRLNAITTWGDIDNDDDYDQLYTFGTRSFSIFNTDGECVFDSGQLIETFIATNFPEAFNSDNDANDSVDSRSDAKGPEPEALAIGEIDGRTYAFLGLERVGGIMTFDITDPRDVMLVDYFNNRDFSIDFDDEESAEIIQAGDLGPEGIAFVSAENSPTGQPILIVANEVSGTTTIYAIGPNLN